MNKSDRLEEILKEHRHMGEQSSHGIADDKAKASIQEYIDQQVREARIEDVRHLRNSLRLTPIRPDVSGVRQFHELLDKHEAQLTTPEEGKEK